MSRCLRPAHAAGPAPTSATEESEERPPEGLVHLCEETVCALLVRKGKRRAQCIDSVNLETEHPRPLLLMTQRRIRAGTHEARAEGRSPVWRAAGSGSELVEDVYTACLGLVAVFSDASCLNK